MTLALPARSFSYKLRRRLVKAAVQNPFHESVEAIADLTGVSVLKRSLELRVAEAPVGSLPRGVCFHFIRPGFDTSLAFRINDTTVEF